MGQEGREKRGSKLREKEERLPAKVIWAVSLDHNIYIPPLLSLFYTVQTVDKKLPQTRFMFRLSRFRQPKTNLKRARTHH